MRFIKSGIFAQKNQKIMFKSGKTNNLVARSKSAMTTFSAMLANLHSINEEAKQEDESIAEQQATLQDERDLLAKIITDNEKVAKKIEDFLN